MIGNKEHKLALKESGNLIENLVKLLKNDPLMKFRFNGQVSQGIIEGHYHSLVVMAFEPIPSILKVKGEYNTDLGELNLKLSPSSIFYFSLLFPLIMVILLVRSHFIGQISLSLLMTIVVIPLLITLGLFFGLRYERKKFSHYFFTLIEKAKGQL